MTTAATLFPSSSPKGDDVTPQRSSLLGRLHRSSRSEVVRFIRWITAGRFSDGSRVLDSRSEWPAAEAPSASSRSACDASAVLISGGKLQTETDLSGCFVPTVPDWKCSSLRLVLM